MKRGESGLSFVLGIDKPQGMSSHDVVSRCRRILGERRIGHAGTLDPLASGVLIVCVGSAARLDKYLTGHDKSYVVDIAFGATTTTDDAEGEVLCSAQPPEVLLNADFAHIHLNAFVGKTKQYPPLYSAIKVGGKKACDEARKGNKLELAARDIEIYSADLLSITDMRETSTPYIVWTVSLHVSKGTYVRSFARDLGVVVDCPAHVLHLRRTKSAQLSVQDCTTLEELQLIAEAGKESLQTAQTAACFPALDPVELLGFRFAFVNEEQAARVKNGAVLALSELELFCSYDASVEGGCDCCSGFARQSELVPYDGEYLCVVSGHQVLAVYCYVEQKGVFKPDCVLSPAIYRGEIR